MNLKTTPFSQNGKKLEPLKKEEEEEEKPFTSKMHASDDCQGMRGEWREEWGMLRFFLRSSLSFCLVQQRGI